MKKAAYLLDMYTMWGPQLSVLRLYISELSLRTSAHLIHLQHSSSVAAPSTSGSRKSLSRYLSCACSASYLTSSHQASQWPLPSDHSNWRCFCMQLNAVFSHWHCCWEDGDNSKPLAEWVSTKAEPPERSWLMELGVKDGRRCRKSGRDLFKYKM